MRPGSWFRPLVFAVAIVASSCTERIPSAPSDLELRLARNAGGPTVTAADPSHGQPGQTLDVRVLGSGYNAGSNVSFALTGVTTNKIVTNRTTFVSSTEVVANITITETADLALYDVIVITSDGKKGIGTEKFQVGFEEAQLPTAGGTTGDALAINDQGVIVGSSTDRAGDRNGVTYPVRWNLVGGNWTITKLATTASKLAAARAINESNIIVGTSNGRGIVWLPNGQTVDLGVSCPKAINGAGTIVGTAVTPQGLQGAVWIRNATGWNPPQFLDRSLVPASWNWGVCDLTGGVAVNGAGLIVGSSFLSEPVKWMGESSTGPWGAAVVLSANGGAYAVNEAGDFLESIYPEFAPRVFHATGEELQLSKSGPAWPTGFSFGMNDSQVPDVVARDSSRQLWVLLGGAASWKKLGRFGGDVRDINNATAAQPMRIVGYMAGKPMVWTVR
ncbi:MAG TPA: hypothetical protein VM099_13700 [Gemmatimonadaceae bacterium]|nr:hypothetical protein [Gemmatimonadaceae bacterium]